MKHITKRLLALLLVLTMSIGYTAFANNSDYYGDTWEEAEELRERYEMLQANLEAVEQQLKSTQAQKNYAINQRASVKAEISVIQEQIDNLNEQMTIINDKITTQEINIVNKEMEIEESQTKFEYRLVANQTAGATDIWTLLFSASSFSEFLTSLETIRQFAAYDTELIKKLNEDKAALEDLMSDLEVQKADLEALITEADEKRAELDAKYEQLNGEVYSLAALAEMYESNKDTIEQGLADAQAEIDSIYQNNISNGEYVGGEFIWPVPSTHYISSYYGWRTLSPTYSDFHTGIDFTGGGCYGKAIVASNAGTVTFVKTTYVPGKGYGKYLIVDHGGGKSTLYAHCSSIAVSVGQYVSQGQTIAYIGSTGFSTGAHLHFEIRINGQHVNPLPYMPGQS